MNTKTQVMVVSEKHSGRVLAAATNGDPPGTGVWKRTIESIKFFYNLTDNDIVISYLWSSMAQPDVFLP